MKKIRSVVPLVLVALPVSVGAAALVASCGSYGSGGGGTTGGAPNTGSGGAPATCANGGSGGTLPCDILEQACMPCVSAHSTVRVIRTGYAGPLYQVCKAASQPGPSSCQGTAEDVKDIGAVNGYADAASQQTFCTGVTCTISKIYDQSGQGNDLEPSPAGGTKKTPGYPARAADLPVTINGHSVYGIKFLAGMGYRAGCAACAFPTGKGTATGDTPQTVYMVSSSKDTNNGCCFDYGNAETTSNDDGNGTMEAVYIGGGVVWGSGVGAAPWVMADLENGLYPGWENGQWDNISTNTSLTTDFVTALIVGDTQDKNGGKGRFAVYGGDATSGALKKMYDNIRPDSGGYVPMKKQGSIILSTGGDNSDADSGRFYEGAMGNGAASQATVDALQAAIVAAGYGK